MARTIAAWAEAGLGICQLVLPSLLAMVPHGAAPLAGLAGLCAAAVIVTNPPYRFAALRWPAALLGALLIWGAMSALWSIDPWRSLLLDLRLLGLFAAALALAAAADRVAAPGRLGLCVLAGAALGAIVGLCDLVTAGGLSQYFSIRDFTQARFNQIAMWLALIALPAGALLARSGRVLAGLAVTAAMVAIVGTFEGTTAKAALALSLPVAGLLYFRRMAVSRIAAALAVLAILTAPLTLPRFVALPGLFTTADSFKDSAGHRLLIWSFVGDRIAERPVLGWGLDSSRAIPGGNVAIRPAQNWLPLHPHDAALQLWLELGAPGAILFAALAGLLWLRLGSASWPGLYAATAGGGLGVAMTVALAGWGIWQEWWLGTLSMALFAIMVMARAAKPTSTP